MSITIAIVGGGRAATQLLGVWRNGGSGMAEVVLCPPASIEEIGRKSALLVLDLPDSDLCPALEALGVFVGAGTAVLSLSRVIPLQVMRAVMGPGPSLFRAVIPATAEPGQGAVALAAESGTSPEVVDAVAAALGWIGPVEVVSEDALDAVAALALGGAAFLCEALQGMEDGAVRDGLPRDTARAFAHQTTLATALLLLDHPGSPADLKDQVASPGGTTIAAIASLEDAGVRGAFIRAVQEAAADVRGQRDSARVGMGE
jgi:pyrroline-5-carboxylate reductase